MAETLGPLVVEAGPACHLLVNRAGRIMEAAGNARRLLGHAPEDLRALSLAQVLAPQELQEFLQFLWASRRPGHGPAMVTVPRRDSGRTLLAVAAPAGGPRPGCYVVTLVPFASEDSPPPWAQLEPPMRRDLYDHFPDGILVVNRRRRIVATNARADALLGRPANAMLGMTVDDLFPLLSLQSATSDTPDRPAPAWRVTPARRGDRGEFLVEVATVPIHRNGEAVVLVHDLAEDMRVRQVLVDTAEREKRKLGLDLHDSVGQQLSGLAMLARRLSERLGEEASPAVAEAERLAELTRRVIVEVRTLSRGMAPPALEEKGLTEALEDLVEVTTEAHGVECRLQARRARVRDPAVATHLFRIAQEAISNAMRHGHARHVSVELSGSDSDFRLSVSDDGVGLPATVTPGRGLGLRSLRQRAEMMGAALDVSPGRSGGVVVTCWKPGPLKRD